MLTNERCYEIDDYIHQLIYHNGENVTEEMKPKNREEQEYFEKVYRIKLESKEEDEDYKERHDLAVEEAETLYRKYRKKDYWSNGIFNHAKLKKYKKEIAPIVEEFLNRIIANKIEPYYSFLFPVENGEINHVVYQVYYEDLELQILEQKYGIDKSELEKRLPKEYYNQIEQIEKKYDVSLFKYYNM